MKSTINYISELNCFHRWLATNYLPPLSQLLWYRLMALFNQSGWETEIIADNATLMQLVGVKREAHLSHRFAVRCWKTAFFCSIADAKVTRIVTVLCRLRLKTT